MSLGHRLDWFRRLIGTAIAFASFGIGGSVLGLLFPLYNLFVPKAQRQDRARHAVHCTFSLFMRWMRFLGVLDWQVYGSENLGRPGQLVIANHPSLLDVVFMMAQIKQPNCVVKSSLWRNPCMIGPVKSAGFISNDNTAQMIDAGVASLASGDCLLIFPEGTRSTPYQTPHFHRGASMMAIKGARVLTPVVLTVYPTTLTKRENWYNIPSKSFIMTMKVCNDIDLAPYRKNHSAPLAARQLNQHLMNFYKSELSNGNGLTY
jgi:1-acyl-sn-glycerol-3-phosphate acyltransferase